MQLYHDFKRFGDAGGFAAEVECVAEEALRAINEKTSIATSSLGSGNAGDAIFLFMSNIHSESEEPSKHAHAFRNLKPLHEQLYAERVAALKESPCRDLGAGLPVRRTDHPYTSRRR